MNSYLLHESNKAFCAFRSTPDLQSPNPNPRGKIVQNAGTITIVGSNETCWYPKPPSKVAGDGGSTCPVVAYPWLTITAKNRSPRCTEPPPAMSAPVSSLPRCLPPLDGQRSSFVDWSYVEE